MERMREQINWSQTATQKKKRKKTENKTEKVCSLLKDNPELVIKYLEEKVYDVWQGISIQLLQIKATCN